MIKSISSFFFVFLKIKMMIMMRLIKIKIEDADLDFAHMTTKKLSIIINPSIIGV